MEIQQARYFLAAAETLNFTRAAARCGVTQPALTRGLRALEAELGGPLFHRERGNTHLSELGRLLFPHLERVARSADEAAQLAGEFGRLETGRLRLGVMCTIAPDCLAPLLGQLSGPHADLAVEVHDGAGPALQAQLLAGGLDAIIYANPYATAEERLHNIPMFVEPMWIVVAPGHPLARCESPTEDELRAHRYLLRTNCEFGDPLGPAGPEDEKVHRSDRDDVILAMAAAGLGYAFMPERSIPPGPLVRKRLTPEVSRQVCLTTVRGRPYSPALGALVREVASRAKRAAFALAS